ncbi:hypothetical protein MLD38_026860 [Melastoma candidum]|uniref:Uncharacterized protein n=1 Tax=Melastoma candidum TaxID=119954 RepID=A0ACB9P0T9_9MYRT|nr:hypothetical protein MLD38_026860 [Melastoma candidum]
MHVHTKTDSDLTSLDAASSPPRSPRPPLYYVQSPSAHDAEKMSYGSSPAASPHHHYYHCSPIHHSRESSTSRFSASLRNPRGHSFPGVGGGTGGLGWRRLYRDRDVDEEDDEEVDREGGTGEEGWLGSRGVRVYVMFLVAFFAVFATFSVILWGVSKRFRPEIAVKSIVFEDFYLQAGNDETGVPTDMLSLNSTVRISYRNPATFFGVHVTATPLRLHYYQLEVASGQMKKFYEPRQSHRHVRTIVSGHQVPLYGSVSVLTGAQEHLDRVAVPFNLTFVMRSRAYILGRLVRSKFYRTIRCSVTLRGNRLGKPQNLTSSCSYR